MTPIVERLSAQRRQMFRAFSHRNYRLFWTGAFLSNVGTWMQIVAQGWLILELTNSPYWLGFEAFVATMPGVVLTLFGGVLADRVSRKKVLLYTQVGAGLAALALVPLIFTGAVQVWMILLASFVTGCCMSLSSPSFQAITIDLAGREDLPNAIALNSAQFQLSRVVGPALAGITITAAGLAGCFFLNALSYVVVAGSLLKVRLPPNERRLIKPGKPSVWQNLLEGFRYSLVDSQLRTLLFVSAIVSLFSAPYISLMAIFARDIHGMDSTGLSLMMSVAGCGAFVGAMLLAMMNDFRRRSQWVLRAALLFGVSMVGFALASKLIVALASLFVMGLTLTLSIASANTLLQRLVTDEMRGRVMSLFVLTFFGTSPIGNYLAGSIAERRGAPFTLALCGACVAVFAGFMLSRNQRLWQVE